MPDFNENAQTETDMEWFLRYLIKLREFRQANTAIAIGWLCSRVRYTLPQILQAEEDARLAEAEIDSLYGERPDLAVGELPPQEEDLLDAAASEALDNGQIS